MDYIHKRTNWEANKIRFIDNYKYNVYDEKGTFLFFAPKEFIENSQDWEVFNEKYNVGDWVRYKTTGDIVRILEVNKTSSYTTYKTEDGMFSEKDFKCEMESKIVWFNIYPNSSSELLCSPGCFHLSREAAEKDRGHDYIYTTSCVIYLEKK